jgi:[1-hydroxy-2-(trimethylamino)ethyl]phosphonate dioxygenase
VVTLTDQLLSIYSSRGADTYFGESVTTLDHSLQAAYFAQACDAPVRLHVPAKRYLCATDAGFFGRLSGASIRTLKLQGGPMSDAEIIVFETEAYCREAIRLRQWDDQGKVAGLATPPFSHYGETIDRLSSA